MAAVGDEVRSEEGTDNSHQDEEHTSTGNADLITSSTSDTRSINIVEHGLGRAAGGFKVVPDEVAGDDLAQESPAVRDEEGLVEEEEGDGAEEEVELVQGNGGVCRLESIEDVGFTVDHVHADSTDEEEDGLDKVAKVAICDGQGELEGTTVGIVFGINSTGHYCGM